MISVTELFAEKYLCFVIWFCKGTFYNLNTGRNNMSTKRGERSFGSLHPSDDRHHMIIIIL